MNGLIPSGVSTIIYFGSEDCANEEKVIPKLGGKIQICRLANADSSLKLLIPRVI
jgi:hypothetical protein